MHALTPANELMLKHITGILQNLVKRRRICRARPSGQTKNRPLPHPLDVHVMNNDLQGGGRQRGACGETLERAARAVAPSFAGTKIM